MKDYWDLSVEEKAALTPEQMERCEEIELMHLGIVPPEKPVLEDVEPPALKTTTAYRVTGDGCYAARNIAIAFETIEEARAFADMQWRVLDTDYPVDDKYLGERGDCSVSPVEVASHSDILMHKTALTEARNAKSRNEAAVLAFESANRKRSEAVSGLYEDLAEARRIMRERERVHEVLAQYTATADGNRDIALKFLRRAFDDEKIADAGIELVIDDMPRREPHQAQAQDDIPY